MSDEIRITGVDRIGGEVLISFSDDQVALLSAKKLRESATPSDRVLAEEQIDPTEIEE